MKKMILAFLFLILSVLITAKEKVLTTKEIPDVISEDLIIPPTKEPYMTDGFKVEKGVTLKILPGVEIIRKPDGKTRGYDVCILIEGSVIIGDKKSRQTVNITSGLPFIFDGATIEVNRLNATCSYFTFKQASTGSFTNCEIMLNQLKSGRSMKIPNVNGSLLFESCQFINMGLDLDGELKDYVQHLKFVKCAWVPSWSIKTKGWINQNISLKVLPLGEKCDIHIGFDWGQVDFSNCNSSCIWYIADPDAKKTLLATLKTNKGLNFKASPRPLSGFKFNLNAPKDN